MTHRAEFERLLDVYGFRCERFGQDLSTHARAQVVSAFAALASAPVAGEAQPVAWANEDGDPISDALKRARLDLYGKNYTRPLVYAAPQASAEAFKDLVAHGISIQRIAPADFLAAPQASEAAQILRKVREDGYLSDTMNHRIAVFLACQPQAGEAVRDGGAEPGTNEPESRANASDTVVLPPLPNTPYTSEGVYCDHWVWRDWQVIEWGRAAVLADRQQRAGDVRDALEMLIREAQAVAADYHRPRYTRLDEAIQSARAALSAQPGAQKGCNCATCRPHSVEMRMILCEVCGDKRCPHAADHRNECTGTGAQKKGDSNG